jgi:hypothetical protein
MDRPECDSPGISSAQLRKIRKPLIERKRRERINESLNQLKTLVLEALKKDESSCTKMDKADILELTVQHLQSMQQRHQQAKYSAGYEECASEVTHYISRTPVHPDLSARLMQHLDDQMMKENRSPATSPGRIMPPSYGVPCTTALSSLPGLCYVAATPIGLTAHRGLAAPYSGSRTPSPVSGRVSLQSAGQRPQDTRTSSPLIADDVPDTDYGRLTATAPHSGCLDRCEMSIPAMPLGTQAMKQEEGTSVWRPW